MKRLPDWPERLASYIAAHRGTPFAWGSNDCVRFAGGAVHAVTGEDPLVGIEWADRAAAARELRFRGGLVAVVDAVLPRLHVPLLAQRGDIVLAKANVPRALSRRCLAVCFGDECWAPGEDGLMAVSLAESAVMAWKV